MRWSVCLLTLGVAGSGAGTAFAEPIDKDFHKEFAVSEGAVLHLEHGDGHVTLSPWDKDVIDVTVRYRASVTKVGMGSVPSFTVDAHETGKTVSVVGKERGGTTLGIMHWNVKEYTYRIQAPPYVVLELKGEDGDVAITGWKADITCGLDDGILRIDGAASKQLRIRMEDGDAILRDVAGELAVECDDGTVEVSDSDLAGARIDTEDGDVRIADSRGDFTVEVDDGDVRMERVHAGTARVRTEDGDVDLQLLSADGIEVIVADGNVRIGLDGGISAGFTLRTDEGTITVDLPGIGALAKTDNEVTGEWHGNTGTITVSTEDGDVLLEEAAR
jgi:DUF4097 and DUF4098 domain-containing protein YvlB